MKVICIEKKCVCRLHWILCSKYVTQLNVIYASSESPEFPFRNATVYPNNMVIRRGRFLPERGFRTLFALSLLDLAFEIQKQGRKFFLFF